MKSLIDMQSGKLYAREDLLKMNLPAYCINYIQSDKNPYFFLNCAQTEDQGVKRLNMTLFPSATMSVFALEVRLKKILPEILHKTIQILRDKSCSILSSTGLCTNENFCLFGIYFASPCDFKKIELENALKVLEGVLGVDVLHFSLNGCATLD